jgi:excisionase family DNA binding protein
MGAVPEDLGVKEAAEELGVSRQTVGRWLRDGLLPSTRGSDGRSRRIARADLLAFAARHRLRARLPRQASAPDE